MLTILIADDEQHIREGIANSIDWQALQIDKVFQAADGEQALQIARENKIDILLSDIRMPIVDGIQLSKNLVEIQPECIIILMSAYTDKEYLMSAIKLKASNYIEKPLQIARLKDGLEEAVKKYRDNEYNKLKSIMVENNYKISMPLIKNEIALLAISKNADMNLLLDCIKNDMLDISANTPYLSVIIKALNPSDNSDIEKNGKAFGSVFLFEFSSILSSVGLQSFWGTRDDEEYVIHISDRFNSSSLEQKLVYTKLNDWVSQQKNKRLFVSIGSIVQDLTHIFISYDHAKSALNKCFYRGYGSVICYKKEIAKVAIIEKEIISQFSNIVDSGMQESILQLLQDFSAQLRRYENSDVDEIKNIYCKLTVILLSKLQNYGVSSLSQYESENSLRNKIQAMNTLDELEDFCRHLLNAYFDALKKVQGENSITMIISYIEKNFSQKTLDICQISQNTFLSPAYLCTYFKRETGKTINQYITDYRLNMAAEYLRDKKYRISDVAGLIGYDDNYFARIFKKKFSISPSEYRERFE